MKFGELSKISRYAIKSLGGESLDMVRLDQAGLDGDRNYALIDRDGKIGSGKNTRRFRQIDGLLDLHARLTTDGAEIVFADGECLHCNDPRLVDKLEQTLGLKLSIQQQAQTPFFDDSPIHILSTAGLNALQHALPDAGVEACRFRPNLVIDSQYSDQEFLGKRFQLGAAVLEVTHATERCRMITLAQAKLAYRPEILKAVAQQFDLNFGVYARVVSAGAIKLGDQMELV